MKNNKGLRVCAGLGMVLCMASAPGRAQDETPARNERTTSPVVVTGTRVEQPSFDLPMAIDSIGKEQIQETAKPDVNISEQLNSVPGTLVPNRDSYAQEQQIVIRGFGARSQFGTRGVKLLADGIPVSTPDGQGSPGMFDLDTAERIEVLRGPFSALYGNHSGGVVQVFTEDGPPQPTLTARGWAGSWDTWKAGVTFGGTSDDVNTIGNLSRFKTGGYREHSAAEKDQFNGKLGYTLPGGSTLSLVVNYLNQPDNQDPLGLTAAQVAQDPQQAGTNALAFNTRRSLDNLQGGLVFETPLSSMDTLRAMLYVGSRSNDGYLAIPLATQAGVKQSGAVSVLDRTFGGGSLRWTHQDQVAAMPFTVTSGVDYDLSSEDRQGFLNNFGVQGASKRDEQNSVDSLGVYVQAELQATQKLSASAGLRYTTVSFKSDDNFICTNTVNTTGTPLGSCSGTASAVTGNPATWNPDDSGSIDYAEWTPVLGALYKLTPSLNLYANIGQSFETPTFIELAYRPDGGSGLNFNLEPATSLAYEIGAKAFLGANTRLNLALFQIETSNEIVVATNAGGRSTFANAPDTQRTGVEIGLDSSFGYGFTGALAATYLDAKFKDGYLTCGPPPCNTPNVPVAAGNKIPGVPPYSVYAALGWAYAPIGFTTGVELRWLGRVYANDTNTESADPYFVAALRAGLTQKVGKWTLQEFGRVDNVFNEEYIGAVAVNDANGRFYFPSPTRSWLLGATVSYAFR